MRKKVLVLCHDTIGLKMAGPGIRYQNIALQIRRVADVTLGVFSDKKNSQGQSKVQIVKTIGDSYKTIFDQYDIIFAQWLSGEMLKYASSTGKTIIIDLYAPVPIEYLASLEFSGDKATRQKDIEFSGIVETYQQYLTRGDYFVCSNDRQRDFWLGFMTALNIIVPTNFSNFTNPNNLALCPIGISSIPPTNQSLELRKRVGIAKDDFVLLWTGGIWDWFDAKVVIQAVKILNNPKIKLVFMGTEHPNSKVVEMSESKDAKALAKKLALTDKSVYFLEGWVKYEDRAKYLMDADVAIYADKDSIETRFSHRTRVLDHIWASLPTICTQGDYLSEVVNEKGMGIIVETRTPEAFAIAIQKAYQNPSLLREMKSNINRNRHLFTWEELTADLLSFIKNSPPKPKSGLGARVQNTSVTRASYRGKALRRVKNAIKVLIGRADV